MRKSAWLLAGLSALAPVLAGQVSANPGQIAGKRFSPPDSAMVLTRTVWRSLSDGNQIVVSRRYAVRFSPHHDGFVLDGKQIDASVDAPAMLAGMAEIERKRIDDSLFPLRLDRSGMILPNLTQPPQSPNPAHGAADKAREVLAKASLSPAQRAESNMFISQLAAQRDVADWPTDMFNPASDDRLEQRSITLPDGAQGQIVIQLRVDGHLPSGLPRAFERTVTTSLAGTSQSSREQWTLAPASGP